LLAPEERIYLGESGKNLLLSGGGVYREQGNDKIGNLQRTRKE
jgi:hypothetical protein